MQSHARFAFYDLLSYITLTAYSVTLLTFSVFESHLANTIIGSYTSEISIVLSVSILSASLIIWGLKFGKTADKHRQCYLALQRLYNDKKARNDEKLYYEILDKYPNHSNFDYDKMLYTTAYCQKKSVQDREGVVKLDWKGCVKFWLIRAIRFAVGLFVIFLPVLIFGFFYVVL